MKVALLRQTHSAPEALSFLTTNHTNHTNTQPHGSEPACPFRVVRVVRGRYFGRWRAISA